MREAEAKRLEAVAAENTAQRAAQQAENTAQRAHELAVIQLQLQNPVAQPVVQGAQVVVTEKPRIPVYNNIDDLPTYFVQFERVCALLQLNDDDKAIRLACSLTGRAAEIYASLSQNTVTNYQA